MRDKMNVCNEILEKGKKKSRFDAYSISYLWRMREKNTIKWMFVVVHL